MNFPRMLALLLATLLCLPTVVRAQTATRPPEVLWGPALPDVPYGVTPDMLGVRHPAFGSRDGFFAYNWAAYSAEGYDGSDRLPVGTHVLHARVLTELAIGFEFRTATTTVHVRPATLYLTAPMMVTQTGYSVTLPKPRVIGLQPWETLESLDTFPEITTTATASSPPGHYPLTIRRLSSRNYTVRYTDGVLTLVRPESEVMVGPLGHSIDGSLRTIFPAEIKGSATVAAPLLLPFRTYDRSPQYNGLSDFTRFAHEPRLHREDFSLTCFVHPMGDGSPDAEGRTTLIRKGVRANYALSFLPATNRIEAHFQSFAGPVSLIANRPIPRNNWSHVAVTFNRASGVLSLYIDGIEAGRRTGVGTPMVISEDLYIGALGTPAGVRAAFHGGVADAHLFLAALLPFEVEVYARSGQSSRAPGTVLGERMLGGGWYESDWFGRFHRGRNMNWVYHATHGWLWLEPDVTSLPLRYFDRGLKAAGYSGWAVASPLHAPFIGSTLGSLGLSEGHWLYPLPGGRPGNRWFYRYAAPAGWIRVTQ